MSHVFDDIRTERENQDQKWGGPDHDDTHEPADWTHYIHQHWRRAVHAFSGRKDLASYRYQLVRVAALCVAAIESLDRMEPSLRTPQPGEVWDFWGATGPAKRVVVAPNGDYPDTLYRRFVRSTIDE